MERRRGRDRERKRQTDRQTNDSQTDRRTERKKEEAVRKPSDGSFRHEAVEVLVRHELYPQGTDAKFADRSMHKMA